MIEEKVLSCPECLGHLEFIETSAVHEKEPLFGNKETFYCKKCKIRVEIIRETKW